jgi:hypothetical protein
MHSYCESDRGLSDSSLTSSRDIPCLETDLVVLGSKLVVRRSFLRPRLRSEALAAAEHMITASSAVQSMAGKVGAELLR